jgi:anthranilate synthase component 2/para-aminobenzoate synthetase component 2
MNKSVVIIDNYDSFVYNLAQYVGESGYTPRVFRNDAITLREIRDLNPGHLIISPGPGTPDTAGISNAVIKRFAGRIPILGVCLGHQCIGAVYGGHIIKASPPTHGKSSPVYHDRQTIFAGLPDPFEAGRYHSLAVDRGNLPEALEISAVSGDTVMGIRHKNFAVEGVQFHPESVMTVVGHDLMFNFLTVTKAIRGR